MALPARWFPLRKYLKDPFPSNFVYPPLPILDYSYGMSPAAYTSKDEQFAAKLLPPSDLEASQKVLERHCHENWQRTVAVCVSHFGYAKAQEWFNLP